MSEHVKALGVYLDIAITLKKPNSIYEYAQN